MAIKNGTLKGPHHSLKNLIELRDKDFLDAYVLLFLADDGIAQD